MNEEENPEKKDEQAIFLDEGYSEGKYTDNTDGEEELGRKAIGWEGEGCRYYGDDPCGIKDGAIVAFN